MLHKKIKINITLSMLLATCLSIGAQAQVAAGTAAPATVSSGSNLLAILLVITALALAFVIWGMGQVLLTLSKQMLEKQRNSSTTIIVTPLLLIVCLPGISMAQDAAKAVIPEVLPNYGGLSATTFYMLVSVIGVEIAAIFFLTFSIKRVYDELVPQKAVAVQEQKEKWWSSLDQKFFTKAIPVEKEADHLLDHNYDGIRELDNALPPWWKYGFIITILVAFLYLINFHVLGIGKNPTEEYAAEMEVAKIQKEQFEAKNKDRIDESSVPMADAAGVKQGGEYFAANCIACHGKLGEGGAGPNLTDNYWLHKGSINDIYQTLKNGYPAKGMAAWANKFNPKELSFIASYIKTLKDTNPPGAKAPQGDIYVESAAGTTSASTISNTNAVTKDSTIVTKNSPWEN